MTVPDVSTLGRLAATVCTALAVSGSIGIAVAGADTGVLPDTPDLPWTDPEHRSPLEMLASTVASGVAGREVRVYCNGQTDWDTLARNVGFDGSRIWGYVAPPRYWYPGQGTWAESSTHTQLATVACDRLWRFGKATVKPTRCAATRTTTVTRTVKVRYRAWVPVKVTKRVRVQGKWVTRTVTVKKRVWKTRVETREQTLSTPIDPLPCFGQPADPAVTVAAPAEGWDAYEDYAFALQTLTHESIHLADFTSGRPVHGFDAAVFESRAECLGMQHLTHAAQQFGASPEDAQAITAWYWQRFYPTRKDRHPAYWSPECRPGGALDQTPTDGIWP